MKCLRATWDVASENKKTTWPSTRKGRLADERASLSSWRPKNGAVSCWAKSSAGTCVMTLHECLDLLESDSGGSKHGGCRVKCSHTKSSRLLRLHDYVRYGMGPAHAPALRRSIRQSLVRLDFFAFGSGSGSR